MHYRPFVPSKFWKNKITTENGILQELKKIILQYVKSYNLEVSDSGVNIWMVLGVNGVGKTTSVAKLASYYKNKGIWNWSVYNC